MINRVILMGRLTAAPELKTTPTGVSVTSFSIAVDRSFVKQGEQRQADFINIVCWRQQAEFVCRYFGKGAMIAVEGRLQTRSYQAKDGTNRYVTEVVADNVSFTGEKRESNGYAANNPFQGGYDSGYGSPNSYGSQSNSYGSQSSSFGFTDESPAFSQPTPPTEPAQPSAGYSNGSNAEFEALPLDDDLPF